MGKRPPGAPPEAFELRRRNDVVFNCYGAFRRCEIPVIGVVRGRAFGFGCAIAAVCDITLAANTAKFQVPEMAHNIMRSEEHTSELQSLRHLVCRLLLEKKKKRNKTHT